MADDTRLLKQEAGVTLRVGVSNMFDKNSHSQRRRIRWQVVPALIALRIWQYSCAFLVAFYGVCRMVDKPDKRPLWITIWGGSADLAQALWKVRKTRSHKKLEKFIRKIRVIASNDQDSTGPWIKSQFPNLFYITPNYEGRGMYRGGDTALVSSAWVRKHIKGHGALGNIYPDYSGGDIWVKELGKVRGIKEGDSPDFLGLIPNGLNVRDHLIWENWGGRKKQDVNNPHHYHDAIDPVGSYQRDISPYLAAVYRWRPAFQADFAARLDWCVKPYSQTNHAPVDSKGIGIVKKKCGSRQKGETAGGELERSGWK